MKFFFDEGPFDNVEEAEQALIQYFEKIKDKYKIDDLEFWSERFVLFPIYRGIE